MLDMSLWLSKSSTNIHQNARNTQSTPFADRCEGVYNLLNLKLYLRCRRIYGVDMFTVFLDL